MPLRLRVAAAYGATTALLLLVLGGLVYAGVERTLVDRAKDGLTARVEALADAPVDDRAAGLARLDDDHVGQVLDESGAVVASSDGTATPLVAAGTGAGFVETRVRLRGQDEPEELLVAVRPVAGGTLLVGTSREDVADALQEVLAVAATAGALGLVVALLLGHVVAGVALRPVEVGSSRVDLQACKLEYSIVSPK